MGHPPVLSDVSLELPRGSRCLLLGANGAGKTTLLQIVAGKYMVAGDMVQILGRSPFRDMGLTCGGDLAYLGTAWRRDVAGAGSAVALQGDITAHTLLWGLEGADPKRRDQLVALLDIDPAWRMHQVSDGQRRRVQIAMGLMKPFKVLLMDEVTVDLDILGRLDLLAFLRSECEERGATLLYATHIFDGLEAWITHVAYVAEGKLQEGGPVGSIAGIDPTRALLPVVEGWLRKERQQRQAKGQQEEEQQARKPPPVPSKHLLFFR